MKKRLYVLVMAAALLVPTLAMAKEVKLTTELTNYSGDGAYLAIYLTDANGGYKGTLWIAGGKSKYYQHLRDWAKGSGMNRAEYDGLTGASVSSGRTLKITLDLDDALFDSGHQIRIDTAAEDLRDNRADVIAPLTTEGADKPIKGRGYVKSFTYAF
jgi:hypothetical protein